MKAKLISIETPSPHQGFLGPGHIARAVVGNNFKKSDPFIMLMDDRLEIKDGDPVGGPHPHAGFETVTLILDGELGDAHRAARKGDMEMMTAGSGIVHTESIAPPAKLHILQLWLTLPARLRWTKPRVQYMQRETIPHASRDGVDITVYSGSFAGLISALQNHTPVIIADVKMQQGTTMVQDLPSSYNTFIYVLEGSVRIGDDVIGKDQVGWLDKNETSADTTLEVFSAAGARFALYSGEPQHDPIYPYGPFVGNNQRDIIRLYEEYHQGKMRHVTELDEAQVLTY